MSLKNYIDHTVLKAFATKLDIEQLCKEAIDYQFAAVCVNGCHVSFAKQLVANSDVKVATVVGFPLGAMDTNSKVFESQEAIKNGADEVDMVINIGALKDGDYDYVENEISALKQAVGSKVLKVIIETCYLSKDEIKKACELVLNAKADYVKTSTGFGTGGATLEDVKLMKEVVGDKLKIKASGGVKTQKEAEAYVAAGASRIGTSSGIQIVTSKS